MERAAGFAVFEKKKTIAVPVFGEDMALSFMLSQNFIVKSPGRLLFVMLVFFMRPWVVSARNDVPLHEGDPVAVFRMVIMESAAPLVKQGDLVPEEVFLKQLANWRQTGTATVMLDTGFLLPLTPGDSSDWFQPPQFCGGAINRVVDPSIDMNQKQAVVDGVQPNTKAVKERRIEFRQAGPALIIQGQEEHNALKLKVKASIWEAENTPLVQAMAETADLWTPTNLKPISSVGTGLEWTSSLGSCVALNSQSRTQQAKHLTIFLMPVAQRPALVGDAKNLTSYAKGTVQVIEGQVPPAAFWGIMRSVRPDLALGKTNEIQILPMAWSEEKFRTFQKVMQEAGGNWAMPTKNRIGVDQTPPTFRDGTHVDLVFATTPEAQWLRVIGSRQTTESLGSNTVNSSSISDMRILPAEALQKRWNLVVTTTENAAQVTAFCPVMEEAKHAGR